MALAYNIQRSYSREMGGLQDIVTFHSARFVPILSEECQVNPEVYGAELAFWLTIELAHQGVMTSYPLAEDWGWMIEYPAASGAEFAVHCYNVDGAKDQWLLSLRRYARKLFGRDMPPYSEAEPLVSAIRRVIALEPSISQVSWLYEDDNPLP